MNEIRANELSFALGTLQNVYTSLQLDVLRAPSSETIGDVVRRANELLEIGQAIDCVCTIERAYNEVVTPASIFHIWTAPDGPGGERWMQCSFSSNPLHLPEDADNVTLVRRGSLLESEVLGLSVNDTFEFEGQEWMVSFICNPGHHDYPDFDEYMS